MFFVLVAIAIIAVSLAIYVYFFLPKTLSSAETADKLSSLNSRARGILLLMADDMLNWANGTITTTTFTTRMITKKSDMTNLRNELLDLKNVADPSYAMSINLLDMGYQDYITALGYAFNLDFNLTSQYIVRGTNYLTQAENAIPKVQH